MIWTQTLRGRAFDLLAPTPEMIDFAEIAETLSTLHRYAGAAEKPVSVALHTLIALDAAPPAIRPHVLLHDAHEYVIGELVQPFKMAMAEVLGPRFDAALTSLTDRIDRAIHAAAGLPLPTPAQRALIRHADLTALMTERRDFLARPPLPWAPALEAIKPLPKKYRLRAAPDVADELLSKFRVYLPTLRGLAA